MDLERGSRAEPCGLLWCVGARTPAATARAAGPGSGAKGEAGVYAAGCGQAAVFAGQGDAKRAEAEGSTGAGSSTGTAGSDVAGDADGAGGDDSAGAD